jgi:chemotaxis protein histidine kinase CheA
MRVYCVFIILLTEAALSTGQEAGKTSPHEDVVKQMLETMDSMTKTLTGINDRESAKEAQPDLRKAAEKWKVAKKKAEDLPPPAKDEKDRLATAYKTKLEESRKKLFKEAARVGVLPGGQEALKEIGSVLDKKKKE